MLQAARVLFVFALFPATASFATAVPRALVPSSAPRGARVLVIGTALDAPSLTVAFANGSGGSAPATIVTRAASFVEAVVPPTAASGNVTVSADAATVGTFPFTLLPDPAFVKTTTILASQRAHDVFNQPVGVAVTSNGVAYVADTQHHQIKTIGPDGRLLSVIGSGNPGLTDGPPSQAQFKQPVGIAIDAVHQLIYVADSGNNAIRRLTFDGLVSTFAGPQAGLKQPAGIALDATGNLYVADSGNHQIRVISPAGVVTTLAGGGHGGFADGTAAQALFSQPLGIAVDPNGIVYVADTANNRIRKIAAGMVSTIAGTSHGALVDGSATVAEFKQPSGIAIDDAGNLLIADSGNNAIRKISFVPGGATISTVAGNGSPGYIDGDPATSRFNQPAGIDMHGALTIADAMNDALRAVYVAIHVSAVYPARGPLAGGNTIRVLGTGFVPGATQVTFGALASTTVTFVSSTELLVTVPPAGAGSVDVKVATAAGADTLAGGYTYLPPPTIAGIQPHKGTIAGGDSIVITGTNFADGGDTNVTIGGTAASSVVVTSPTSLTAITPPGASGAADVSVATSGGTTTKSGGFVYFPPPVITSFVPVQGGTGTAVAITGQNFDPEAAGDQVTFGGVGATVTSATATQLVVSVPNGASTGRISVTTAGGSAQSSTDFVVATFTGVRITSPSTALDVGTSIQFNAIGVLITGGGTDVTSKTSWTSNGGSISVTSTGVVTAVAAGSADITAAFSGFAATIHVTASAVVLPPDPATVAPKPDPTVVASFADEMRFLYSGPNAIQTGVAANTISDNRAAAVRGAIRTSAALPLPGVRVTVLGHPEYGQTLSRTDGVFDFAINGGGTLSLRFEKSGYIGSQRAVTLQWNQQTTLTDTTLIAYDSQATAISTGASDVQVARSSMQSDADGARQTTLIIPSLTNAVLTYPDGTTKSASTLTLRATEFTVGSNGTKAMPAALPATSAYTYCVELSADEAATTGASSVQFSKPIPFYVDNFLNLPVGTAVPVGYYDRQRGAWISSPNGIVLKILGISNGSAAIDTNGDGIADDGATLASFGIDSAEQQKLATLYTAGKSLWRIAVMHFSPIDCNWPYVPPLDAISPSQPRPDTASPTPTHHDQCGPNSNEPGNSIVNCYSQTLTESIPIVGTSYRLEYDSSRAVRPPYRATIHLSSATLSPSLRQIEVTIGIAGRSWQLSFAPQANLSYEFSWDGNDAYGRLVQGVRNAVIEIAYVYSAVYAASRDARAIAWARVADVPLSATRTRDDIRFLQAFSIPLGHDAIDDSFGGWSLSAQRFYDGRGQVLYDSGGQQRSGDPEHTTQLALSTVAGNGQCCFGGDGGPATQAKLSFPHKIAIAPDGALYLSDSQGGSWYTRVRRVDPKTGIINTVAGNGTQGFTADGAPAAGNPIRAWDLAVGPDGSLYINDQGNALVRRVVNGIMTTVAGTGVLDSNQNVVNGAVAISTAINPQSIAVGPDGSVYIGETKRISRVGTDGLFTTLYGGFNSGTSIDAIGIGVGPDGTVYGAATAASKQVVYKIAPSGQFTVIGGGGPLQVQDGALATSGWLCQPWGLAVAPDGTVLVSESGNCPRIRAIAPDGIITTMAGTGAFLKSFALPVNGLLARSNPIGFVSDVKIAPDGSVYFADGDLNIVRRAAGVFPAIQAAGTIIPSADGSEAYVFEGGRHVRTVDTLTGTTLLTLGYGTHGFVTSLTDADGNVTTIQRDAAGGPTAIIAPGGQQTTLTLSGSELTTIRNPAGEGFDFTYNSAGLLAQMTDPRKGLHTYTYDQNGLITKDEGPDGSFFTFSRSGAGQSHIATRTTAEGRVHAYRAQLAGDTSAQREYTAPDGTRSLTVFAGALETTTFADGSSIAVSSMADPRFGMQAPLPSLTLSGGGKTLTINRSRTTTLSDPLNPLTLTSMTDKVTVNGSLWTSIFTAATGNIVTTSPKGRVQTLQVDAKGRVISSKQAGITDVGFSYDSFGHLSTLQQGTRNVTFGYDSKQQLTSIADPLQRTVHFDYDAAGRVTSQTLPDGRVVAFSYDAAGNLLSLTPPGRSSHAFSYTAGDLTSAYTPPSVANGGVTQYAYNKDRQLTLITRPDGKNVSLSYDTAGRLNTIAVARGSYGFAFNSAGQVSTITAPDGGQLLYAYNGPLLSNVTWSGFVNGNVSYAYDNNFRLASETAAGSTAAFTYDADGLLVSAGALTLTRDSQNDLLTGSTLATVTDAWTYNQFAEPQTYTATAAGGALLNEQFTRNDAGQIVQKNESILGETHGYVYTYDAAGRLSGVTRDGASIGSYTYDGNSNRLPGTYDDQDRMLTYGAATYTYTANGELVSKTEFGATTTYTYDELGNLTHVILPGQVIDYVIDGQNRRVGKKVNGIMVRQWLYGDALRIVAELDGTGALLSRFVYGSRANVPDYMIRGGATYRIISDHLGSPRLIVESATGSVAQWLGYDAFGVVSLDTNPAFQPFGFAGGLYDPDTQLVRFGARDYDPRAGRWTAKDPSNLDGGDTNLYRYVFNDPINSFDRDGENAVAIGVGEVILTGVVALLIYEHLHTHPEAMDIFRPFTESRGRSTTAPGHSGPRPGERYHEPLPQSCDYPVHPGKTVQPPKPDDPCQPFLEAASKASSPTQKIIYLAAYVWCKANS